VLTAVKYPEIHIYIRVVQLFFFLQLLDFDLNLFSQIRLEETTFSRTTENKKKWNANELCCRLTFFYCVEHSLNLITII